MHDLTVSSKCIVMRGGMQHWVSDAVAEKVTRAINSGFKGLLEITELGSSINPNDISGIYSPQAMEVFTRQRNGEWQCKHGNWHQKFGQCECGRQTDTFKEQPVKRASQETVDSVRKTIEKMKGSKPCA